MYIETLCEHLMRLKEKNNGIQCRPLAASSPATFVYLCSECEAYYQENGELPRVDYFHIVQNEELD